VPHIDIQSFGDLGDAAWLSLVQFIPKLLANGGIRPVNAP